MAEFKFEGTKADVAVAKRLLIEAGLIPKEFEVGDYVVCDEDAFIPYNITHPEYMKLGKVTRVEDGEIKVEVVEWHDGSPYSNRGPYGVSPKCFRKATAEEMPDPRKLAFEAAGRMEDEFKKGDIVMCSGTLREVLVEDETGSIGTPGLRITDRGGKGRWWLPKSYVKLIAPVESRVDKHD